MCNTLLRTTYQEMAHHKKKASLRRISTGWELSEKYIPMVLRYFSIYTIPSLHNHSCYRTHHIYMVVISFWFVLHCTYVHGTFIQDYRSMIQIEKAQVLYGTVCPARAWHYLYSLYLPVSETSRTTFLFFCLPG